MELRARAIWRGCLSPDGQHFAFFERYALPGGGAPKPNDIVQQWQTTSVWEVSSGRELIHSPWTFDSAKQAVVNKDIPWTAKQIESWLVPAEPSPQAKKWDQQHPPRVDRRSFLDPRVVFSQDGRWLELREHLITATEE